MSSRIYRIRRAFLTPFALVVILLFVLLLLSFVNGSPAERVALAVIFPVALLLFFVSVRRRIVVSEGGIRLRKFLKDRELCWGDITQVGLLAIRQKVYLLLTTKKGFHILSNAYGDFPLLVRDITGQVDGEKVEQGVSEQIEHPLINNAPLFSTWGAALIIIFIIAGRLFFF